MKILILILLIKLIILSILQLVNGQCHYVDCRPYPNLRLNATDRN